MGGARAPLVRESGKPALGDVCLLYTSISRGGCFSYRYDNIGNRKTARELEEESGSSGAEELCWELEDELLDEEELEPVSYTHLYPEGLFNKY